MNARQELIIAFIAMGMGRKECAAAIKLSRKCVEWHLDKIKRALGFNDPARLTHYALSRKLVRLNQTV